MTKCNPHYHNIQLPSGRLIKTKTDCIMADEELGFLPALLGAAIPAVGGLVSGLVGGGGKKKGAPAPAPTQGMGQLDSAMLTEILRAVNEGLSKGQVKTIVKDLLQSVPPPVRKEVKEAINEVARAKAKDSQTLNSIVTSISGKFNPQFDAALKILKASQLQTQATNEHKRKVNEDSRWKSLTDSQKRILARIDALEKNVISNKNKMANVAATFGAPAKVAA